MVARGPDVIMRRNRNMAPGPIPLPFNAAFPPAPDDGAGLTPDMISLLGSAHARTPRRRMRRRARAACGPRE